MKTPRLALALLGTALALACAAPAEPPAAPKIGSAAPDFTLPPAAGGPNVQLKIVAGSHDDYADLERELPALVEFLRAAVR